MMPPPPPASTRKRPALGIRGRLMLVVLAMVLPWLALTALTWRNFRRERERETRSRASDMARLLAARVDDQVSIVDALLLALVRGIDPRVERRASNDSLLLDIHDQVPPFFHMLAVWDSSGTNVGTSEDSVNAARGVSAAGRRFFQEAMRGRGLAVGEPIRGPLRGRWTLSIARPLLRDGRATGVVSATTELEALQSLLLDADELPDSAVIAILDQGGQLIARSRDAPRWIGMEMLNPTITRRLLREGAGVEAWPQIDGSVRMVSFRAMENLPWLLVVGFPETGPFAGEGRQLAETLLLASLALAVALVLAWTLATRIARPVRQLTADAQRLGAGDFAVRATVSGNDELSTMAQAFNSMAATLESRTAALVTSEERYRLAARATTDVIYDWDLATDRVTWAEGAHVAFRVDRGDLGGSFDWWQRRIVEEDRDRVLSTIQSVLRGEGRVWELEYRFALGDGAIAEMEDRGYVMRDESSKPLRVIGSMLDLTARHRAERERDRFFSLSVDSFCIATFDGIWKRVNPAFCATVGYDEHELVDTPVFDLVHPDDREEAERNARLVVDKRRERRWSSRLRCRDGSYTWLSWTVQPDLGEALVYCVARDVTEERRAAQALRESEEWYRLLYDANPLPMWVYDVDTLRFLSVNDAAVRHYGYSREEFLAMDILAIRPPEEVSTLMRVAREPVKPEFDHRTWRHMRKDGSVIQVEVVTHEITVEGRPARLTLSYDVTERKMIEEQLRQSQKMEAVGQLAGGVAHDFNNLLTVISSYSRFLIAALGEDDPRRADAQQIQHAAGRAAALTRQLLAFSRRQVLQPQLLDINEVIGDMHKLLGRVISENIQLITHFEDGAGTVRGDRAQLEQVVMNLVVNACDAMPNGGTLGISTRAMVVDAASVRLGSGLAEGRYVMFAVRDTGVGIDRETQARIFEPFFTTKSTGKGTGLGLSTVYGIVKQSGGHIEVRSTPGRGTTFEVYLPEVLGPAPSRAAPEREQDAPRGSETVLVAEDEDAVRMIVRRVLRDQGYHILEARDGEEALALHAAHRDAIELVVTDVIMPRMGGRELARRLGAIDPGLPVLYMSGYTDDRTLQNAGLEPGAAFLAKPFATEALVARVRELLEGARERRGARPVGA
jgi:two-component system cell cycle sensor histidine kinase/response regulator CckA